MPTESAKLQLAVLMFTDIVNSVSLQKKLGTEAYTRYISRHDEIFKECLMRAPGGRILNETGDGFLVRLNSSSDAVNTALRLQYRLHSEICEGEPMAVRIGLHSGEITEMQEALRGETRAVGMAINLAARIMDLAAEGQILMTRAVFDDARQFTRHYPDMEGVDPADLPPLLWPAYGRYIFKGNDEPMEIYGVGAEGITPLVRPEGSEKAKRAVAADEEAILGWRPGAGLAIPRREDWVIEKKIGEGGFGEVWLAENKKIRMQRVFKFCFDADRLRSFKRELTLFRLLQDALGNRRDIAALYEVSVEAPPYYLESEYVPTGNISQWFTSKGGIDQVPLTTRLHIMAKAARAVAAAHSVGIIHKDIKPSNILISEENGIPEPRLADFGIGTLADTSSLLSMGITHEGFTESVILEGDGNTSFTHLYAPPEYLVGKPASVRGDIYSLGVMLYQLAVGDLNSPLGTGWSRGIDDTLLADDIRRCVDVDPERRFQSASHLAEHLEQLDKRHAEREEEQRVEQLKQHAKRRKRTTILTVSISCGLALMTALLAKGYVEQKLAKEVADSQTKKAKQATGQLRKQASNSDFLLAGQLLARHHRSEALAYLARAVEGDHITAGRKLMATLAASRFPTLRQPPIDTLTTDRGRPLAKDVSPDGSLLAAVCMGENGEEMRVWNLSANATASEHLEWKSTSQSERVMDLAFASDTVLSFVTKGDDNQATIHLWERTPQWAWVRSEPVGQIDQFSSFVANGAVWIKDQRIDNPEDQRRGPPGGRRELILYSVLTGNTATLPAPRGRIVAMDGFYKNGGLDAAIVVCETRPDQRFVSAWSTSFAPVLEPEGRRGVPFGPPGNDGTWRTYLQGSAWSGPPITIAISPDGKWAAVPEPDGSVHVCSLVEFPENAKPAVSIPNANDLATGLEFGPNSDKLAIGYFGSSAAIFDIPSGVKTLGPIEHEGGIIGITFSSDGARLLTRSLDQTARVWDAAAGVPLTEPMIHDSYVVGGYLSPDSTSAVTIGYDGETKVWNIACGDAQGESLPVREGSSFSAISPDWETIFTTTKMEVVPGYSEYLGQLHTLGQSRIIGQIKGKPLAQGARIIGSRFTTDGKTLIAVRLDGTVVLHDVDSGHEEEAFKIDSGGSTVQLRAISGDGTTIAIATQYRSQIPSYSLLSVWHRRQNKYELASGIPDSQEVGAVALNGDGSRMVTSHDQALLVWERNAADHYQSRAIDRLSVTTVVAMSQTGDRFVAGSAEGTLQAWSFNDGKPLTRPLKQSGPVIAVALSPDGLTAAAATTSLDGGETARVQTWDLTSQESLTPSARFFGRQHASEYAEDGWQQGGADTAAQLAFSPDLSQVLLHFRGDTVVWDMTPSFADETVPPIIPRLAKAIGGLKLPGNPDGAVPVDELSPVAASALTDLRAEWLAKSNTTEKTDSVDRWVDWLLSPPGQRSVSPTSKMTREQFTEFLVRQNSEAALHEAVIRNPGDRRIRLIQLLELAQAKGESGGTFPLTPSQRASLAELLPDFLKSTTPTRAAEREIRPDYRDRAKALALAEKLTPHDPELLGYYLNSLKEFTVVLEQEPGDLDAWLVTAQSLDRIAALTDENVPNGVSAEGYSRVALVIFAMLAEQGLRDASFPAVRLSRTPDSPIIETDVEDGNVSHRDGPPPRGRRFQETDLSGYPIESFTDALSTLNGLPPWLDETLSFFLQASPAANSAMLWSHRAFVQACLGQEIDALEAANRALEIGISNENAARRLERLRGQILTRQGETESAKKAMTHARGIRPRPVGTSPAMLDLEEFFTDSIYEMPGQNRRMGPGGPIRQRPQFAIRPGILITSDGISFDARGIVYPAGDFERRRPETAARPTVEIPVGQNLRLLHFLHAAMLPGGSSAEATGSQIGEYTIRYDDGSSETLPIRVGFEVDDWKPSRDTTVLDPNSGPVPETGVSSPVVAWSGFAGSGMEEVRASLFVTSWTNPKPDLRVESIDFTATDNRTGQPFLVALTLEP
ncbi:MAG: protein kinase [Verrucomicrobiales bacterium]